MAYKALYRTYRPLTFQEVAGQKAIIRTLQNALANNKVAHAYLFAGPRGTGKTTMAKLMAKALNCEEGIGHQCNKCDNCLAINNNSHPDVVEIDAASNNGVDEVRSLVDNVAYLPIKGRYKVYIIDEVHMMTTGAFNALLKTLEEPPSHIVFILATTEAYKIIPTIISRTQRYDFAKVSEHDIKDRLIEVLRAEKAEYNEEAINEIITLADGGVRDALSLLDQALSYSNDKLSLNDIIELFGLVGIKEKIALLSAVANHDGKTIIELLNQFAFKGADLKKLVTDLLDILKDLLIFEKSNDAKLMKLLKHDEALNLINEIGLHNLEKYIDELLKVQTDFKVVSNIRLLLELVFLKLGVIEKEEKPFNGQPVLKKPVFELESPLGRNIPKDEPVINVTSKKEPLEKEPVSIIKSVKEEKGDVNEPEEDLFKNIVGEKPNIKNNIPFIPPKVNEQVIETKTEEKKGPEEIKKVDSVIDEKLSELKQSLLGKEDEKNASRLEISDEDLIKIMVQGQKDNKQLLINDWSKLSSLHLGEDLGIYALFLKDGRPLVLTENILILEYDTNTIVEKINLASHQKIYQGIIEFFFKYKVNVYALTRKKGLEVIKVFRELAQLNKLPKNDKSYTIKGLNP